MDLAGHVINAVLIEGRSLVADLDQLLKTFSTSGAATMRQHGCTGSHVFRDPDDATRVWVFFDWRIEEYERFLADPEISAIARDLALRAPPVEPDLVTESDS
jgi:quinol monooxygenase YgiN